MEVKKMEERGKKLETNSEGSEDGDASRQQSRKEKELQGEFWKIRPPTYDGEKEEDVEALLLNMVKYFQFYEYGSNLKAILAIYKLQGKEILCWEETKMVDVLDEKTIT